MMYLLIEQLVESTIADIVDAYNNHTNSSILTITSHKPNQPDDLLPLLHPELIDWDLHNSTPELDTF